MTLVVGVIERHDGHLGQCRFLVRRRLSSRAIFSGMTIAQGDHAGEDMHAMLLRFLGAFTHLQDCLDTVVPRMFFDRRMPKASKVVWKRTVYRITDEERIDLFMAIADEVATDAELKSFKAVYMRAKRLRDSVAHSARIAASGQDRLEINRTVVRSWEDPELAATELGRAEISRALRDSAWLEAQIVYVLSSKDLAGGSAPRD